MPFGLDARGQSLGWERLEGFRFFYPGLPGIVFNSLTS